DITEMCASVSLDVYALITCGVACQAIFYFSGEVIDRDFVGPEEDVAIAHYRHQQRVFLVRIRHLFRIVDLGHVDADTVLQHGRDYHEDDQQHQHHVHHRGDVDVGVDLGS